MTFTSRLRRLAPICLIAGSALAWPTHALATQQVTPDNTKVNARDRVGTQKTADQQKNDRTDVETTREIRQAIVADKSLSTYAHNIKIITTDGTVTLKGPVKTPTEKRAVETKAAEVAGAAHVKSQISVTEKSTPTHPKSSTKHGSPSNPKASE